MDVIIIDHEFFPQSRRDVIIIALIR